MASNKGKRKRTSMALDRMRIVRQVVESHGQIARRSADGTMKYVREYRHDGELVAILVRKEFQNSRPAKHAVFVSATNRSLQLGVGYYPRYLRAPAHTHKKMNLRARYEELLHLVRGRMRVDLYSKGKIKFASFVMRAGDTVHFISGGHGFRMLSPCKCVEVKQGPYMGRNNKSFF